MTFAVRFAEKAVSFQALALDLLSSSHHSQPSRVLVEKQAPYEITWQKLRSFSVWMALGPEQKGLTNVYVF